MQTLLSVPEALARLAVYRTFPRNVVEAMQWLEKKRGYSEFLLLYLQLFPSEFATSEASIEIEEAWSYSPREIEFFYLVDERLFPLNIDFLSDVGANGERVDVIYPIPYETPWWYEPEVLSIGWQVLRLFAGVEATQQMRAQLVVIPGLGEDLLAALLTLPGKLTMPADRYVAHICQCCEADPSSPLRDLGLALALLLQRTGNPWLDTDSDNEFLYEGYWWTLEHVKEMAADYRAAQAIEQRVRTLVAWLEADLCMRIPPYLSFIHSMLAHCDLVSGSQ